MKLTNRKATKAYLLQVAATERPFNRFSRVSGELLDKIEARVRAHCVGIVKKHPSRGVTLKGE